MPFHVFRISRALLASALVIIFAIPQDLLAQTQHLVSPADLRNELLTATRRREQNQLTVRQFLTSADAQQAIRSVHLDPVLTTAVATLSDTELAQLAARADQAQRDFAAGALGKEALLIIAVAVAVVIIIVAVKT
jgi:hypothetical protein